jgi:transglutaminase-like putative cysteine protease
VVEVGSRHIRDVSKYLNFPLYSNARVYIISFPEITEGSSIEYKVKIQRNQLVNKKDFVTGYPLQAQEPIIAANFSIVIPKEKTLYVKTLNEKYNDFGADLKPKIQPQDNRLIYSWQFKNIPQIIPESNMPPDAQINPTILVSTFSSWQEVYNWWWQLAQDKIQADAAIKTKVRELTGNQDSEEKKIRAISNFCAQKIRYVAVEYGQAGYEPHFAGDIFKNKYGDCKDQAILLVTMLKEAGFRAFPVLIPTRESYNLNEDFPAIFFNHCIAAVSLKDKIVFLDPTAETCSFGDLPEADQGRQVLLVQEGGYKIQNTPLYPAEHNFKKQYAKIKINSDETIAVEKSTLTYGVYDQAQRYWMLYTPPELVKEALKEKIQVVSIGATLDNYEIKNLGDLNTPMILNYTFRGTEYLTEAGKTRIRPQLASLDTTLVAKDKRKYPIDFSILDTEETVSESRSPRISL